MMPFIRGVEPACLKESSEYIKRYLTRIKKYQDDKALGQKVKKPSFDWPKTKNVPLNHLLLQALKPLNGNHCSYCDGFPLGTLSRSTIDHFKPKESYPDLAFNWHNLYLCCDRCQSCKSAKFDELLLRPDESGFEFLDYFMFNFRSGEIEVNPFAPVDHQARALVTLKVLDLNDQELGPREGQLPQERLRVRESFNSDSDIETLPYRFMY